MRAVLWAVLVAVMCVAGVRSAWADGKVFASSAVETPRIPDQQALIVWDERTHEQTLAIETRFEVEKAAGSGAQREGNTGAPGQPGGSGYAWVVPVPGPGTPHVEQATTGLFPTLRWVFQPRVIHGRGEGGVLGWVLGVVLLLVLLTREARVSVRLWLALVLLFSVLFLAVLLPALGTARSIGGGSDGVEVLSRSIVGSYDVSVIGAAKDGAGDPESGRAIAAWLVRNGYVLPPACDPVLTDYSKRGWVFVASKLRTAEGGGRQTAHPIVMKFRTPEPVYPLMLTGVENGELDVELFVFGRGTAVASGFKAERTGPVHVVRDASNGRVTTVNGRLQIGHPEVLRLIGGATHATKLVGRLTQEQMSRDAELWFTTGQDHGGTVYTERSAEQLGTSVAGLVFLAWVVLTGIAAGLFKRSGTWTAGSIGVGLVASLVVCMVVRQVLPRLEERRGQDQTTRVRYTIWQMRNSERVGGDALWEFEQAAEDGASGVVALERVREFLTWYDEAMGVLEEDSPFNYRLRLREDGRLELTTYDLAGTPRVEVSKRAATGKRGAR